MVMPARLYKYTADYVEFKVMVPWRIKADQYFYQMMWYFLNFWFWLIFRKITFASHKWSLLIYLVFINKNTTVGQKTPNTAKSGFLKLPARGNKVNDSEVRPFPEIKIKNHMYILENTVPSYQPEQAPPRPPPWNKKSSLIRRGASSRGPFFKLV